jgi:hypothetical protein
MKWFYRDASWYNRPETRVVKKLHLKIGDSRALCREFILLQEFPMYDDSFDKMPEHIKCKRCLRKAKKI